MNSQKYSVNQQAISILLAWVEAGEIAIPEIQRPFVWDSSRVRDLIDSLYQGFPIGYVIAWQNPNVRLKDGTLSRGKKILIDGQQRVTALCAAILGQYVVNKEYNYLYIQQDINIKVGDKSPDVYFKQVLAQCRGSEMLYGGIDNMELLQKNLEMNCIPDSVFDMSILDYDRFLQERRQLMARKIRDYYFSL